MAKLLKAKRIFDLDGTENGVAIIYRVGGDIRSFWLSGEDINGLNATQIRALAQSRADADTGADGSGEGVREDVLPSPTKQARQFFASNPALRAFFEQDIAAMEADIDSATLAQLKELVKALAVICRTYGLLEIAD